MKAALAGFAAAVLLTACGSVPAGGPAPNSGSGFDLVVSDTDTAATMHVGQTVEVVLHARQGMNGWKGVRSSDTSVLAPIVNPAATPSRGVTLATFRAVSAGRAEISATTGPICGPEQACPQYLIVYGVEVTVTT
jgi:hypothetical protein